MLNITKFALRRPITLVLALVTIFFFGFQSVLSAKQELMPEMNFPMLIVSTVYNGAGPEDVTELVTKEIEEASATLNGVKTIYSLSRQNVSFVQLQYDYGSNMDTAYLELKKVLDRIKPLLPKEVEEANIIEFDINAQASMELIVSGGSDQNPYNYVKDNIIPELQKLSSVADVSISGGRENYVKIELIPEKLTQYKLSTQAIAQQISTSDFSMPAGSTSYGRQELNVNISADYKDIEKLKNIVIPLSGGEVVHLSDIANVSNSLKDKSSISRYNKEEVISLSIQKNQRVSAVDLSKDVYSTIEYLSGNNDKLSIEVMYDAAKDIKASIKGVLETLIIAIVLSMIVLFVFFGNIKASLIVGSSIPISVFMSLTMMGAAGFSMNTISIGGLSLGVGMIVDNSIVVIESCFRSKEGRSVYEAAVEGTGVVLESIIGATLTTCVVFLPLALLKGLAGQVFNQLGFTIVFCMLSSLMSAAMIVPLLFKLLEPGEKEESIANKFMYLIQNGYRKLVVGIIPRKILVIFIAVVLLGLSFFMVGQVGMVLFPAGDSGNISISVKLQPGLNLEKADEIATRVEDILAEEPDMDKYRLSYTAASTSVYVTPGMNINAYLKKDRSRKTQDVMYDLQDKLSKISDASISISMNNQNQGVSDGGMVRINLQSTDYESLKYSTDDIVELLREQRFLENVHSDAENAASTIKLDVDPVKAQTIGLSPVAIAAMVNQAISGTRVMTYSKDGSAIEVRLEYPKDEYPDLESLSNMLIPSMTGQSVVLEDIADINFGDSPATISRQDKQYQVAITANIVRDYIGNAQAEVDKIIDNSGIIPKNVTRANSAYIEMLNEEMGALIRAVLTAVFLIFIVMAMQFESPRFSLMVMFTIPFSLIGAFGLLYFADVELSMPAMIGLLMMVGTVVNNGILYVDTVNQYRADGGMEIDEALIEAGATRLRPILMTTLTTILAMLPLAFAYGEAGESLQGLALVNVGGLLASTILSLIMLPTLYKMIAKKEKKVEEAVAAYNQ